MSEPLSIMEQLSQLSLVQEIDLKILNLETKKASLPDELKSLELDYRKAKSEFEKKNDAFAGLEKSFRQAVAALELNEDRMTRAAARLEEVKTGPEFQASNKEMEQLKKLKANLEGERDKMSTELETAKAELETVQARLAEVEEQKNQLSTRIDSEQADLAGEVSRLGEDRKQYLGGIERQILSRYDRVRRARAGIAVVPAVGGRCAGCNMVLAPQLYNEVHRGSELLSCPTCMRMLYLPVEKEAAPAE